jgi:hypothetical protein
MILEVLISRMGSAIPLLVRLWVGTVRIM